MNQEEYRALYETKDKVRVPDVPSPDEPETPTTDIADECKDLKADGDICGRLAQTEGTGAYTQDRGGDGASGRYQITQSTAEYLLVKSGKASSSSQAASLWANCRSSSSPECQKLQDDLCNYYTTDLSKGLVGDKNKFNVLYLRYNMGPTGANEILAAYPNKVTDPERIALMNNQAWMSGNPGDGDTVDYLSKMNKYIIGKKVNPTASI